MDVWGGIICLYHRGKTQWYSLEEERRKVVPPGGFTETH